MLFHSHRLCPWSCLHCTWVKLMLTGQLMQLIKDWVRLRFIEFQCFVIYFIHTLCSLKRNISQISENGLSVLFDHLIVLQSLNCHFEQWSCIELNLYRVNTNQSNMCVVFIISMFVVLNYTKVLRLQSLGNDVVHTVCYQFIIILHLLLIHSMSSQFKMTLISKGINQNYLCKLFTNH